MAFWGATVFFAAAGPCRVMSLEKKKKVSTKKRQRFRKNHRRGHRTRARARINITPQTYGTEEALIYRIAHNGAIRPCRAIKSASQSNDQYRIHTNTYKLAHGGLLPDNILVL